MILTFLQNAWFNRPLRSGWEVDEFDKPKRDKQGRGIPLMMEEWSDEWRVIWLWATARSRSGARLRLMLGQDCFEIPGFAFSDASPKVSYGSSAGYFKGDSEWVAAELAKFKPAVVVCCGNEATNTVTPLWQGPVMCVPHPTSRVVTNALYRDAGSMLMKRGFRRRVRFLQGKDGHSHSVLPPVATL